MSTDTSYHKIETLYERDLKTFKVNPGVLKNPVYGLLKQWEFTEKIDGTNIRIVWKDGKMSFGGKTDNAQIHADLIKWLYESVKPENLTEVFPDCGAIIYGEGYGSGIQKGGIYSPIKKMIVFDVLVIKMVSDKMNPCPIHRSIRQDANITGPVMAEDSASLVTTEIGSKDILNNSKNIVSMELNIGEKIKTGSEKKPQSGEEAKSGERSLDALNADGICKNNSESVLRNMTISQKNREMFAQSVEKNKQQGEEAGNYSPSWLTTAIGREKSEDFSVVPATWEFIKQNLQRDGWMPPRCICVQNRWWLNWENTCDVAMKLGLNTVPYIGLMSLEDATDKVRTGFKTALGDGSAYAEGLVGRPQECLFDKKGHRLILKLKTKDF